MTESGDENLQASATAAPDPDETPSAAEGDVEPATGEAAADPATEPPTAPVAATEPETEPEAAAEPEPDAAPEPEPEPVPDPVVLAADDPTLIDKVREAVTDEQCIVIPTDTVYGIAANAFSREAVQRLLTAKGRDRSMPPPVLIADSLVLDTLAKDVPDAARALAEAFWPGPLTLILKAFPNLQMDLGNTNGTVGVRVPDNDHARAILQATGPLAVSSANASGEPPATDVAEAVAQLHPAVALYVDGGPTPGMEPSTIVDFASFTYGRVVRSGRLSYERLQSVAPALEPLAEPAAEDVPDDEPDDVTADGTGLESDSESVAVDGSDADSTDAESTDAADAVDDPEPASDAQSPSPTGTAEAH